MQILSAPVTAVEKLPAGLSAFDTFSRLKMRPYPFFLDSASGQERLGQFSFVGSDPFLILESENDTIRLRSTGESRAFRGNPFSELRQILRRFRTHQAGPVPFLGGAVGYFGYDLCHFIERLPRTTVDDIAFPELHLAFYDRLVAFDHRTNQGYLIAVDLSGDEPVESKLRSLQSRLETDPPAESLPSRNERPRPQSNFTRQGYLHAIHRAKEYIAAGDIFQVNLSQRFQAEVPLTPSQLYRRIREINPAPFAAYLQWDDKAILSSSPERFLRVTPTESGFHVETRPIKGTRPRTEDESANIRLRQELLESEKDNAELTMIVDLERNDLGRVCSYGTVRVTERRVLEAYPTVYHLVATIEGELYPDRDLVDLLRATFPGGSITGAPKIRSMEIIDELEPTRRNVYTGAIGYLGFNGAADLNIVIRTLLMRGREVFLQVGGGIVADSVPEDEYDETLTKARALFRSLGM